MHTPPILPFTTVFIRLLKGPVEYLEKSAWEKLLAHEGELSGFVQQLGLSLVTDKEDGYAYLKQNVWEEDSESNVSWTQRRPLSYDESVLLVLLREMLLEFEIGTVITRELVRKRREIKEYAELFFRENVSRVKFIRELDRLIDKAAENGFLEQMDNPEIADEQKFRIKKLIKAKVDTEVLEQFKNQLSAYAAQRLQHG